MYDMNIDRISEFIIKRHTIYLKKEAGEPSPWSDDPILNAYKFTNLYRELDRTTLWCKDNVRDRFEDPRELALAITAFRWVNRIETGEAWFLKPTDNSQETAWNMYLSTGNSRWLADAAYKHLGHGPYVTGAYIIKTPEGLSKLEGVLSCIDTARIYMPLVVDACFANSTLRQVHDILRRVPYLGSFTAAQLIADMKHTKLLAQATDHQTFTAIGPGSQKGLNALCGRDIDAPWHEHIWYETLMELRKKITPIFVERGWPVPDAQDVQNIACEYSKYVRGKSRNRYRIKEAS
jgi:hypothetical protein